MLALWGGILAGPIAFLAILEIDFALVPWACAYGVHWILYLVTVAGIALTAGAGALARSKWREAGQEWPSDSSSERARFMAAAGVVMSAFFALVMVAHGIVNVILGACQ